MMTQQQEKCLICIRKGFIIILCPYKRSLVGNFLKLYCIDIVLLQESKIASPSDSFFRSIGGSLLSGWIHLNSIGASRGQLIGWLHQ